ncbi:helix-turn-helix transcriptional regulator [Streptococcus pluranimalium]|uniref:helix-turn-helix transcriptional regulator n=1 Tax=Streptococcus pluranimalium TaxID=82348 RepID=UPI0024153DA3|nr:helix-turn-helix domain-containing protein [Streptococcus pluranimalium]WFM79657.1 helix-turn-helix domain-containing protein [Streptococcus pluranimalium]
MTVKNKVRGYRNMLGKSQEEMGKLLGMTKQSYYSKENGKVAFSDKEKLEFKKLLLPIFPEITLEDIFF